MSTTLKAGDPLPSVGLRATDGYLLNLRSFVTKQPVLLLFFGAPTLAGPAKRRGAKAIEALSADYERLREAGIAAAAISTDSEQQQTAFAEKHELPFLLLSDERRSAVDLLGIETVADEANVNVARPVALAVDREGIVRGVIDPVEPEGLVDRAVRALSEPLPTPLGDAATPS
ncbi:MAG TPA: redoxin domain-containing protein [Candidatus Limnocylindria bacterium]